MELEFELSKFKEQNKHDRVRDSHPLESSHTDKKLTINTAPNTEVPKMHDTNFNLDNYLTVFERLATAQNWSKSQWVSRLTTQFNSKCQDIFSRIDVSKCQDYEAVKKRLREGYNLGPKAYRKEFGKLIKILKSML